MRQLKSSDFKTKKQLKSREHGISVKRDIQIGGTEQKVQKQIQTYGQ